MDSELLYLNGVVLPLSEGRIHVEDRGFQLGDGVYEVVKVLNGRALWLQEHLERLVGSLAAIGLGGAADGHGLREVIPDLVQRSGVVNGSVYVQVTRGVSPRDFEMPRAVEPTVLAYARSRPALSSATVLAGETVYPVDDRRWAYCNIKAIDLLATVLAKDQARSAGADEALFVASDGSVREGGSSNVFAVLEGTLRTHPADDRILGGITRRKVIEVAQEAGCVVEERAFVLGDITSSAAPDCEVFITSTLKGIMPIVGVGTHAVGDGRPGKLTLALLERFRRLEWTAAGPEVTVASS
jgi:D-alanine transaminase